MTWSLWGAIVGNGTVTTRALSPRSNWAMRKELGLACEEETDKVKENIPETLVGNRIAIVIRAKIKAIKGGERQRGGGFKKRGTFRRKNQSKRERVTLRKCESYLL